MHMRVKTTSLGTSYFWGVQLGGYYETKLLCLKFRAFVFIARARYSIWNQCTTSVQCEGTHSLGIGFSWFKKANNRPNATWNTSQCETATYLSLSAALVSVPCLAIFRIRSVTRNSLRLLPGYVPYTSVTRAFLLARALSQDISACSDWHTALPGIAPRVCTLVLFILSLLL